jgi:quinol-cytochrome oxidoreductase complex cytochrome b subunit
MKEKLYQAWRALVWTFDPADRTEAGKAVTRNFWLHWFPPRATKASLAWSYSFWLGTISTFLFLILVVTGVILMFLYVPSVERAYQSIKDLEHAVSFGWLLRNMHRWSAHMMVAAVFLHMVRVFYTGAYKNGMSHMAKREINWVVGMILLILTLLLSFSGYLLPWDQLAIWAVTVGTQIALSIPVIGDEIYYVLAGGTRLDQNALIRFYTLHVIFLPLLLLVLFSYHMWRVRKDEGLAAVEQFNIARKKGEVVQPEMVFSSPWVVRRIVLVFMGTFAWVLFLSVFLDSPLEEPASLEWTPNPAKAPWYFLWLQELVTITTIRIGGITLNGGFIGGVIIPGILAALLTIWAFIDKSPAEATGVWFHKSRLVQNLVFTFLVLVIVGMIIFAMYFRGPYWEVYWPWAWPELPEII